MKNFILTLIVFTSTPSYSLEVVLFGGGGEGKKESTIFDNSLKELAKKKQELNLNIKSVFNSGHSETEAILRDELQVENSSFTSENYDKTILDLVNSINSGKIKEGEKLLIIVDTHGGVKTEKHQTHSIAMSGSSLSDLSKIEGPNSDSIDKLKVLSDLALSKGIKLGIIDFSCHSGNTLALANQNTCVIAGSGPNHFAYGDFPDNLYKEMRPGLSLEDVFLNTKKKYTSPAFPMISTAAGLSLNEELYSLISPYLNIVTQDGLGNKLKPYLDKVANPSGVCQRENDFQILMKKIESFVEINGKLTSQLSGESDLVEALKDYKAYQDKMISDLISYNHYKLDETVTFEYFEYTRKKGIRIKKKLVEKEKVGSLFSSSYLYKFVADFKKDIELARSEKPIDQQAIDQLEFVIEKYEAAEALRKKILIENPNILKVSELYKDLPAKHAEIWSKATKIQELVNKIYAKNYQNKKEAKPSNEACSDFIL